MSYEYSYHFSGNVSGKVGRQLLRKILSQIKGFSPGQSICELGCGNGYLAGYLADLGHKVMAVDISETGIQLARKTYGKKIEFLHGAINETLADKIGKHCFDLVISCEVIEHLYRPADLLNTAKSLLKTKGYLLLSTPYHGYLKNLFLALSGKGDSHWNPLWDGGHIKFFSKRTLTTLMHQYGFEILHWSFYGRVAGLWKGMICFARLDDTVPKKI